MRGEEDYGEQAAVEHRKKSEDSDICSVGFVNGEFLSFSLSVHTLLMKTGIFHKENKFLR